MLQAKPECDMRYRKSDRKKKMQICLQSDLNVTRVIVKSDGKKKEANIPPNLYIYLMIKIICDLLDIGHPH